MSERERRVMSVFEQAIDLDAAERRAFLEQACGADLALRAEVEALLRHDELPPAVLQTPALGVAAMEALAAVDHRLEIKDLPERIGQYRILSRLGQGGMGTVFRAEQERPRRVVALKLMRGGFGSSGLARRFEYEAEILGRLQHPGIAQIYEAGTYRDRDWAHRYIAMELIEGLPIDEYARQANLGLRQRLQLVALVCDAIQHAHQHGVIHRDLKPANILVDPHGQPKLLDFGVARAAGDDLTTAGTLTGQLVGTLPYMSPEQVSGSPDAVDTRSDVYSLGVLLFQLLTGRMPYNLGQCSVLEAARIIRDEPPTRIGSTHRTLRGDVETIVGKALEKDKQRRYQSAADLAGDIRRHLAGEPIEAKRDSALYVLRKTLRRYRGAAAAAGAVLTMLIAFAIYAGIQAQRFRGLADRERVARHEAEAARDLADRERARADRTSERLAEELSASVIERGRLIGRTGNLRAAEDLLWPEYLRRPDGLHAHWALWELYSRLPCEATWYVHEQSIAAIAVSPDGKLAATGSFDQKIRIWNVATRAQVGELSAHTGNIRGLEFLPDWRLVSVAEDGRVIVWNVGEGRPERDWSAGGGGLFALAASNNGEMIATGANDGTVQVWRLRDGASLARFNDARGRVWGLDFDAQDRRLAAGGEDRLVHVWELGWRSRVARLAGHTQACGPVAFHPNGRRLVSGSTDGSLRVWDIDGEAEIERLPSRNGTVRWLAYSPDGRRLLSGGWWRVDVWDAASNELLHSFTTGVNRFVLTPDSKQLILASGGPEWTLRVWDVEPSQERRALRGAPGMLVSMAWSPDGRRVAVGNNLGQIEIFELEFGLVALRFKAHEGYISDLAFSPDGSLLASVGRDGGVRVWSSENGGAVADLAGHTHWVNAVRFSDDGRRLVTGSRDMTVRIWELDPGLGSSPGTGTVTGAATAPAGRGVLRHTLTGPTNEVLDVDISPDGRTLAAVSRTRRVDLWRFPEGEPLGTFEVASDVWTVDFSPDGRELAFGTWAPRVEIWDLETRRLRQRMEGHTQLVTGARYLPGGRLLVSCSADGAVMLWDVATGQNLASLSAPGSGWLRDLGYSPDGRWIAAVQDDGGVLTWDMKRYDRFILGNRDFQAERLRRVAEAEAAATQPAPDGAAATQPALDAHTVRVGFSDFVERPR